MKFIPFLLLLLFITACSSTKQAGKSQTNPFSKHENIKKITLTGTIQTNLPDMNQSAEFSISISGGDSASISIFGPLGMIV